MLNTDGCTTHLVFWVSPTNNFPTEKKLHNIMTSKYNHKAAIAT